MDLGLIVTLVGYAAVLVLVYIVGWARGFTRAVAEEAKLRDEEKLRLFRIQQLEDEEDF
jgi:hypothetical protein